MGPSGPAHSTWVPAVIAAVALVVVSTSSCTPSGTKIEPSTGRQAATESQPGLRVEILSAGCAAWRVVPTLQEYAEDLYQRGFAIRKAIEKHIPMAADALSAEAEAQMGAEVSPEARSVLSAVPANGIATWSAQQCENWAADEDTAFLRLLRDKWDQALTSTAEEEIASIRRNYPSFVFEPGILLCLHAAYLTKHSFDSAAAEFGATPQGAAAIHSLCPQHM